MLPHLPLFEAVLKKRGRLWKWSVCAAEGRVVMQGADNHRPGYAPRTDLP
jgi:hypothetical protein